MTRFSVGARRWLAPFSLLRIGPAAGAVAACALVAAAVPGAAAARVASGGTGDCNSLATCYSPGALENAYSMRQLYGHGVNGRGQTVVLPEEAQAKLSPPIVSNIFQDLAAFDRMFHLPPAQIRLVTKIAGKVDGALAGQEEVLDAEMVHTVAPETKLVIVLVPPNSLNTPSGVQAEAAASLRLAQTEGGIISASEAGQGGGEHCLSRTAVARIHAVLQSARRRHVTVVAASGDVGAVSDVCAFAGNFRPVKGVTYIGSDPLVLAAGGTSLTASHTTGAYRSEIAWGLPFGQTGSTFQASGGGFSKFFAAPSYQHGVPGIGQARGVPDVSADASGHTGMAIAISTGPGKVFIRNSGGTSATAPLWAGVIALADQLAGHRLGFVNPAIYQIARGPRYHQAFHDITAGNNTVKFPPRTFTGYQAARGWDPVTGWGSPVASVLVPLLAHRHLAG